MPPKKKPVKADSDEESNGESESEMDEQENDEGGSESGDSDGGSNSDSDNDSDKSNSDNDSDEEEEEEDEEDAPILKGKGKRAAPASKKAPAAKKTKKAPAKAKKVDKKKAKAKAKSKSKSKPSSKEESSEPKLHKLKATKKSERLEEARKAYKWWEAPKLEPGINWHFLEHPGVKFAPPYERHNVPLYYNGKALSLTAEQEEVATFFAAMPLDGPQLGNPKTKPVFERNFLEDFQEVLGTDHQITSFEKLDFSEIRAHLDMQKSLRKAATDEEKAVKKAAKEQDFLQFGYALIDGRVEKMGNYNMEPPGLFRGRGEHPKTGKLKARTMSESVHLNVSPDACVPVCALPGHAWGSVRHDPGVTWLCSWNENVNNSVKYVMLNASSSFKGKSDMDKYGKAIKLKHCIHKVRADYTTKIRSKDRAERQLGVAMWVIDVLALRVGGEKGEDEADTVGCCSLRVEHLHFNPDPTTYEIELEFLGKDSMLFKQTIFFNKYGDNGKAVYKCLQSFVKDKGPDDDVFEFLTPPVLNKHLNSLMKGLTAKVFRTYNASVTLEKELPTPEELEGLSVQDKVLRYNAANRQVAILCNHQRTVSKAQESMFENLNEKLNMLKEQRGELAKWKELLDKKKADKVPLKEDDSDIVNKLQEDLAKATERKEKAKSNEEKLAAAQAFEEAKARLKDDQKRRFQERHKYKTTPTKESIEARIEKWGEEIRKMEVDIRNRDENKEVALGTSKINYMDPRISVAWCKRCEVPIDKVFARTLRDKFNWAMAAPPEWKFE